MTFRWSGWRFAPSNMHVGRFAPSNMHVGRIEVPVVQDGFGFPFLLEG
jgi:hypothetical protein